MSLCCETVLECTLELSVLLDGCGPKIANNCESRCEIGLRQHKPLGESVVPNELIAWRSRVKQNWRKVGPIFSRFASPGVGSVGHALEIPRQEGLWSRIVSFSNFEELIGWQVDQGLFGSRGPTNVETIDGGGLAESEPESLIV